MRCDQDSGPSGARGGCRPSLAWRLEGAAAEPEWLQRAANNHSIISSGTHAYTRAPCPHAGTMCSSGRECRRPRCAPPRARPSAPRASRSSTSTPPGCPASPGWAARSLSARCCSRRSTIRCSPRWALPCHACPLLGRAREGGGGCGVWGRGGWTWPGLASARVPARNSLLTHARAAGAEPRGPVSGQDARADPAAERRHHVGEGRHVDAVRWEAQDQDGHLRPTRRARCRARRHTCRPLVGVTLG